MAMWKIVGSSFNRKIRIEISNSRHGFLRDSWTIDRENDEHGVPGIGGFQDLGLTHVS